MFRGRVANLVLLGGVLAGAGCGQKSAARPDAATGSDLDAQSLDDAAAPADLAVPVDAAPVDVAVETPPPSDTDAGVDPDVTRPPGSIPMFIAVGYGFRRVLSCTDGRSWQLDDVDIADIHGLDDSLAHGPGYFNGLFVAPTGGAANGGRIMTTTDGVTWTERVAAGKYNGFSEVAYGNGTFVACGGNVSIRSKTGVDGWGELSSTGGPGILRHMVFGGGRFVAVGGNRIEIGTDGTDWRAPKSGTCGDPLDVVYGNGRFLAVDLAGATCLSTDGGDTWANGTVGGRAKGIVWTGTDFLVTSADRTYRSADGATWTSTPSPGGGPFTLAVSDSGTIVGFDRQFYFSTDGVTWTVAPELKTPGLQGITKIVFGYGQPSAVCPLD